MNRTLTAVAACTLALAACGGPEVDKTNASAAEVAEAVADADGADLKLAAGRWESNLEITEMNAPGMPPEMAQAMKGMLGEAQTFATCLTPEEAAKPTGDFFNKDAENCTYEQFRMGNGRIDAKMTCSQEGNKMTMAMAGTYSPKAYDMAMESQMAGGGQAGMSMKMKVKSAHVGACRGDEDAGSNG